MAQLVFRVPPIKAVFMGEVFYLYTRHMEYGYLTCPKGRVSSLAWGRVFDIPLKAVLRRKVFYMYTHLGYLTCPQGRIADLPPRQGIWPALRAGSLTFPKGIVSEITISAGSRLGVPSCELSDLPPGEGIWPALRAESLACPQGQFIWPALRVGSLTCHRAGDLTCHKGRVSGLPPGPIYLTCPKGRISDLP